MHTNTYLYVGMCVYVNQHIGFNFSTLTRTANGRKKSKQKKNKKRYNNNSNTVYVDICIRVARRVIHINVIIYLTLKTAKFKAS